MQCNRKQFLAGAGTAAAIVAGGVASAFADEAQAQPWMPEKWDYETDVLVIGSGSIITAALRAHDEGLNVMVIEKHPTWFGGTTAYCGGGMTCPNSYLGLEAGMREIPRDLLKEYFISVAEGESNEELIDMILDNCNDTVRYMNDECGFQWKSFGVRPQMGYNFYYPYPEIESQFDDTPNHVTIGQYEATGAVMGGAIAAYAKDALDARGIEVMLGTAATKLIYAGSPALGDGEVIGAWAETADGPIAIKARYAVVLGTGGYDHNADMVTNFLNHPVYGTAAVPTNTGDGHVMAAEVGAKLTGMNNAFWFCVNTFGDNELYTAFDVESGGVKGNCWQNANVDQNIALVHPGLCGNIVVNRHGERFMCEGGSYDLIGRAFDAYDTARREWRNIPAFVISDFASCRSTGGAPLSAMVESGEYPEWMHVFETLEELADGMGINKEKLLATVERWNAACEEGVDEDWLRGEGTWDRYTCGDSARVESGELKNPCMAPLLEGPFYCFELRPGMMATAGGIQINANAQVKNVRGEIIPRLYAGSNCIANTLGRGYPVGGNTIANGLVVGYVAAGHIATLQPWE